MTSKNKVLLVVVLLFYSSVIFAVKPGSSPEEVLVWSLIIDITTNILLPTFIFLVLRRLASTF
jgi:hypothetical protein